MDGHSLSAPVGSAANNPMPSNSSSGDFDVGAALDPTHFTDLKEIPATRFAALVGRSLRTLRNWDEAGLTHPEWRNSRRYYGIDDLRAVLAYRVGQMGARQGSPINYLAINWDSGT